MAAEDVGVVTARALSSDGHAGKAYVLTGPEAITIGQAAETIGELSERSVRYVDVPEQDARAAMLDAAMPKNMVDAMMELHAIDKAGHAAAVTTTVKDVTGRAPMTFKEFARKNASNWERG